MHVRSSCARHWHSAASQQWLPGVTAIGRGAGRGAAVNQRYLRPADPDLVADNLRAAAVVAGPADARVVTVGDRAGHRHLHGLAAAGTATHRQGGVSVGRVQGAIGCHTGMPGTVG